VSPRRARRRDETPPPLFGQSGVQGVTEQHPDGEWVVRPIAASEEAKGYRCPGCDHTIAASLSHLVAWRPGAEDDRRHWHTPCWRARDRRAADVQRSRNAPRYG
jgi:hypothetical protein